MQQRWKCALSSLAFKLNAILLPSDSSAVNNDSISHQLSHALREQSPLVVELLNIDAIAQNALNAMKLNAVLAPGADPYPDQVKYRSTKLQQNAQPAMRYGTDVRSFLKDVFFTLITNRNSTPEDDANKRTVRMHYYDHTSRDGVPELGILTVIKGYLSPKELGMLLEMLRRWTALVTTAFVSPSNPIEAADYVKVLVQEDQRRRRTA